MIIIFTIDDFVKFIHIFKNQDVSYRPPSVLYNFRRPWEGSPVSFALKAPWVWSVFVLAFRFFLFCLLSLDPALNKQYSRMLSCALNETRSRRESDGRAPHVADGHVCRAVSHLGRRMEPPCCMQIRSQRRTLPPAHSIRLSLYGFLHDFSRRQILRGLRNHFISA